jgi:hypothetical protein
MAVRMKYAGLNPSKIIIQPSLQQGIEQAVAGDGQLSYILCTYTALFASRKILIKMQKKYPTPEPGRASMPEGSA